MEIAALILMGLGIFSMVANITLQKWLFNNNAVSEIEAIVSNYLICTAVLGLWFFSPINTLINTQVTNHPDNILFWSALIVAIMFNGTIHFAQVRSYKLADQSLIAPIQAMTPGILVFSAMFLGEYPSTIGYLGIFLIVAGTYVHIREGAPLKEYFKPLYVWRLFLAEKYSSEISFEEKMAKERERSGLRWAYLTALLGTFGLISTSIVARHGDVALYGTIECLTLAFIFMGLYPILRQKEKKKEVKENKVLGSFLPRLAIYWPQLSLKGFFYAMHFIFIITAFRIAPVAHIGSLKRLSIVFTVLAAVWFLGEKKMAPRRIALASIIVAGAVLLSLDPTQAVVANSIDDYLILFRK